MRSQLWKQGYLDYIFPDERLKSSPDAETVTSAAAALPAMLCRLNSSRFSTPRPNFRFCWRRARRSCSPTPPSRPPIRTRRTPWSVGPGRQPHGPGRPAGGQPPHHPGRCPAGAGDGGVIRPPIFRYDIQKDIRQPPREAWWRLCACPCAWMAAPPAADGVRSDYSHTQWPNRRRGRSRSRRRSCGGAHVGGAPPSEPNVRSDGGHDGAPGGPDHVFEMINPALKRAVDDAQLLGRSLRDIVQTDRGARSSGALTRCGTRASPSRPAPSPFASRLRPRRIADRPHRSAADQ